jgi:hypothetical protein
MSVAPSNVPRATAPLALFAQLAAGAAAFDKLLVGECHARSVARWRLVPVASSAGTATCEEYPLTAATANDRTFVRDLPHNRSAHASQTPGSRSCAT